MNNAGQLPETSIIEIVKAALDRGARIDIDGLGSFLPNSNGGFVFASRQMPKIFITYVHEDFPAVDRLGNALTAHGFDPWIDRRKLLPGQNWPRAIEDALSVTDFVIACFSTRSTSKRGGFQAELRYALDCARRMPLESVFLIPVRLDDCRIPARIESEVQYVDLFPSWADGFARVLRILEQNVPARTDFALLDY